MDSGLGIRRRRALHVLLGAGMVMAASAALAVSAIVPNGGSNFNAGNDGWTSPPPGDPRAPKCTGPISGDLLCDAKNERVAEGGNPGGALRSQTTVIANAGGTFTADFVWLSPSFTVDEAPFEPTFFYDRRLDSQGLVKGRPTAEVKVELVNETAGGTRTLVHEDALSFEEGKPDDSKWDKRVAGVVPGALTQGAAYRLEIGVTIRSTAVQAGLRGTVAVLFDNIGIDLAPRGPNSPGVTQPQPPGGGGSVNEGDITILQGQGPGGSVIPLNKCTIVGTEGDDVIKGSNGNDIICALAGDDKINARKGFDAVDAGDDDDKATGGKKTDLLLGLGGNDALKGAKGADRIGGGSGRDKVDGGPHNDKMWTRDKDSDRVKGGGGARDRVAADRKDKVKNVPRVKVK